MLNPQAITLDWWEGHFRLENPNTFKTAEETDHLAGADDIRALKKITGAKEGAQKIAIGKTVFKRLHNGNQFYRDYYQVWRNGKQFGVALANSRDKRLMAVDDIQLQVNNNKLYETGWLDSLKAITQDIGATFHNFTRLDIAVDGAQPFAAYNQWEAKQLIKVGRANINKYMKSDGKLQGFYIGMSKSKKRIKCYNKSEELNKSNKKYIEKFWKKNNLDTSSQVERIELTIRNEESKKFPDINWQALDQPQHLASIMYSNIKKFCEFRIPGEGKNISRFEEHKIIDFKKLKGEGLQKDSTKPTNEVWSGKITCKKLFEIYYLTKDELYFNCAFEIAMNAEILEWFTKMQAQWIDDINSRGKQSEGILEELPWKFHFKRYEMGEQTVMHVA